MVTNKPISKEYFIKRLTDLCLKSGLAGFPKDETSLHIILKSAMLMIDQTDPLTEKEINAKLEMWVMAVGENNSIDRVSLRRELIDMGYLIRSADGSIYQIAQPGPCPDLFDEAINQLDIPQEIESVRKEIARRKREYLAKSE